MSDIISDESLEEGLRKDLADLGVPEPIAKLLGLTWPAEYGAGLDERVAFACATYGKADDGDIGHHPTSVMAGIQTSSTTAGMAVMWHVLNEFGLISESQMNRLREMP